NAEWQFEAHGRGEPATPTGGIAPLSGVFNPFAENPNTGTLVNLFGLHEIGGFPGLETLFLLNEFPGWQFPAADYELDQESLVVKHYEAVFNAPYNLPNRTGSTLALNYEPQVDTAGPDPSFQEVHWIQI